MEQVILVDENDLEIGVMDKMEAHEKALLHRAFSVFIFNAKGEMLLQQRAESKYHSAGLWTNACCSHPRPGEDIKTAAVRRLNEELGFSTELKNIFDNNKINAWNKRKKDLTLDDIPNGSIKNEFIKKIEQYGYTKLY